MVSLSPLGLRVFANDCESVTAIQHSPRPAPPRPPPPPQSSPSSPPERSCEFRFPRLDDQPILLYPFAAYNSALWPPLPCYAPLHLSVMRLLALCDSSRVFDRAGQWHGRGIGVVSRSRSWSCRSLRSSGGGKYSRRRRVLLLGLSSSTALLRCSPKCVWGAGGPNGHVGGVDWGRGKHSVTRSKCMSCRTQRPSSSRRQG